MPQMNRPIIDTIDRITEATGRALSWLTMVMVVLVVAIVVGRYFLGLGSIALQESVTYLHAMVFMLGLAFTLKRGGHVRVDIFYRNYSVRQQALVDLIGGLVFLVPFCLFIFISCWTMCWRAGPSLRAPLKTMVLPRCIYLKR